MTSMRSLWIVALAACHVRHDTPDADAAADSDAAPSAHVDIQGACAFPLATDGALEFPATAVAVQSAYRPIDVVNTGIPIVGRELIHWEIEGVDAANFSLSRGIETEDSESCSFQTTNTIPFAPGDFCRLDVTFEPQTPGPKQATLHVTFEGMIDQTFSVRGTAVASPTALFASMPDVYVKPMTMAAIQSFRLVNAGATNVDLGNPVIAAPFASSPQPGWTCTSPLIPSDSCNVGALSFDVTMASGGCPMGSFTTSTGALTVPLTARFVK
jgi:hypothetical protein